MPSDDIDLERGVESDPRKARRARRREQEQGQQEAKRSTASQVTDTELRSQLNRAFDGLVKNREKRGDDELAEAFREEGDAMTEGFVTLTDSVKAFRMPLILILNLIITLLAFGRVGGILLTRIAERRQRRAAEAAAVERDSPFPIEEQ